MIQPDAVGRWTFTVEAFDDPYLTWWNAVTKKIDAGQGVEDLANDIAEGAEILRLAAARSSRADRRPELDAAADALRDEDRAAVRPGVPRPRPATSCCGSTRCASW